MGVWGGGGGSGQPNFFVFVPTASPLISDSGPAPVLYKKHGLFPARSKRMCSIGRNRSPYLLTTRLPVVAVGVSSPWKRHPWRVGDALYDRGRHDTSRDNISPGHVISHVILLAEPATKPPPGTIPETLLLC